MAYHTSHEYLTMVPISTFSPHMALPVSTSRVVSVDLLGRLFLRFHMLMMTRDGLSATFDMAHSRYPRLLEHG